MRLPETVKVGAFVYTIVRETQVRSDDDRRLCGQINYMRQEIHIGDGMAAEQEYDTFLHEVLHAIDHNGQMGLSEKQIHRLASALLGVLLDNDLLRDEPEE